MKYLVLPWAILVLPWGFWFCREVSCFCREFFGFVVMFLFLPWGFWFCFDSCGPPYKIGPLQLAIHVVQNSHARWRAKVALWQDRCLLFVFFLSFPCATFALQQFCITWISSCKGPIGCVRAGTVGKQVMSQICADAQNCAVRYSANEGVVRPRGSMLWYYPFVHNCSASYLTKCSEPKEFYLSLHFCVFLLLFRLLAHVRGTRIERHTSVTW